jgi:hypothetical protein
LNPPSKAAIQQTASNSAHLPANRFDASFGYVRGWRALQIIDLTSRSFYLGRYEPHHRAGHRQPNLGE